MRPPEHTVFLLAATFRIDTNEMSVAGRGKTSISYKQLLELHNALGLWRPRVAGLGRSQNAPCAIKDVPSLQRHKHQEKET